jgi:uncharacterized protein (DUF1800 family)
MRVKITASDRSRTSWTSIGKATVSGLAFIVLAACSKSEEPATPAVNGATTLTVAAQAYNGVASSIATFASASGSSLPTEKQTTPEDTARFLTQATFGITSEAEVNGVRSIGYERWLEEQFKLQSASLLGYLEQQAPRTQNGKPTDEMAYEGLWQQWLYSPAQLRARVAFALSQIMVVSNVSPELNGPAMASYMDLLSKNAFGNYRKLLEEVTLHPAMGYYLNMIESEKENPDKGSHPNENYAREVLQLFSIGLMQLNLDGTQAKDAEGKTIPTYDEDTVKGFAKAFSGWSFGGRDTAKDDNFHHGEENWTIPMQAWASKHSTANKKLLNGTVLPAGQTPQQDLSQALDNIFNHPNVGPFISRRLIQRLVSSNPSPAYIQRVATVFNNNGAGVRGDLQAVVKAILLDAEARDQTIASNNQAGKLREPIVRLANVLRFLNARSEDGTNRLHYLDNPDWGLGQSPLLAPSVFNFYSPDFRAPGEVAKAGMVAPEFQITTETSIVGSLNFMAWIIREGGYGNKEQRLKLDFTRMHDVAGNAEALANRINLTFMNGTMTPQTRTSFMRVINGIDPANRDDRIKAALVLTMATPEFTIQK